MILFSFLFLSLKSSIKCRILPSHDIYLQSYDITCGTKLDTAAQTARSRVLNGEQVSNKEYPWLAQIWTLLIGTNGRKIDESCGGVIISRHAILTAGHCLCNDDPDLKDGFGVKIKGDIMTCGSNFDLNRRDNQIYYSIGTQSTAQDVNYWSYNARVAAYLFEYDPSVAYFSKNGDIGIVIDKDGLPLIQHQANPICLPTESSFTKSKKGKGIKVALAGRGLRYFDNGQVDQFGTPITSCLTNDFPYQKCKLLNPFEALKPYSPHVSYAFCVDVPVAQDLISSEVNVVFDVSDTAQTVGRIVLPEKEKCQEYWEKALEAYRKANENISSPKTSIHNAHKIILRKSKNTKDDHKVCFNWKKLSVYGVCKTTSPAPLDWGFCSRSCQESALIPDKPIQHGVFQFVDFEEFKALYFENPNDILRPDSLILGKVSIITFLLTC